MIKLLSLFSGIGAFECALRRGGHEFQTINYCEIDKYASAAYSMIHNVDESLNLRDVRKVSTLLFPDVDLVTYGFPCQDISIAGRQKGFEDGAGNRTRSGLFFDALRIIQDLQPKWAICENVKALTMKQFKNEFKTVLESLEHAGYRNYYQVLNSKDFGIPQNRERVFIVSIRKDIEQEFTFPETQVLKLRVRDLLEKDVPEKFFINTPNAIALARKIAEEIELNHPAVLRSVRTEYGKEIRTAYEQGEIHEKRANMREFECRPDDLCNTLTTVLKDNYIAEPVMRTVGDLGVGGQRGRVFSINGIVGCLSVTDYKDPPKILQVGNIVKTGQFDNPQRGRIYDPDGIAPTLNTCSGGGLEPKFVDRSHVDVRIRKLTPRECFRLMGFTDDDFDKIKGISNSQLYKMAGNSIVVNVLTEIFKELFKMYK
ncbi:DNA cytosine methyltransferase [Fibrobacter sp.]|uniref:DNA cytosine methyltransferase n=1 Tax=Fibrobacter sp. TaxID=35828 RepID=UPI00386EF583